MNHGIMQEVFTLASRHQERRDKWTHPIKLARKKRAAEALAAKVPYHGALVDIGGEEWYQHVFYEVGFTEVVSVNLPQDIHHWIPDQSFVAATAMHILEHSPCPAYILRLLVYYVPLLWVAVPLPTDEWVAYPPHITMMPPDAWAKLITLCGWQIALRERKQFGSETTIEECFLCVRDERPLLDTTQT